MNDAATWEAVRGFLPAAADQLASITFFDHGQVLTAGVATDADGHPEFADPESIWVGLSAVDSGDTILVLVDSYSDDISHIDEAGNLVRWVTSRGWGFIKGIGDPLPAADIQELFGVDQMTGLPLPGARGIRYADSWLLTGNPGGE